MTNQRKPNSAKSILLLSIISLFSCVIGAILGATGLWYYEWSRGSSQSTLSQPGILPSAQQTGSMSPIGDGLFLAANSHFLKLTQVLTPSQIDFAQIPSTNEKSPILAIRGTEYPLGNLQITGYYAGVGVDADFTQAGAVVKSVFAHSTAQTANLKPGDLIASVDGELPKMPMIYHPDQRDLFGIVQPNITLVVISGTISRTVQLPRTYVDNVDPQLASLSNPPLKYSLEPKGDYVLLHITTELKPGVYRVAFQTEQPIFTVSGPFGVIGMVPTRTPIPTPTPVQKWVFEVK